jgi:hypothetical protein
VPKGIVFLGFTEGQILIFDFHQLAKAEKDEYNVSVDSSEIGLTEYVLPIIWVLNAHEADIL